MIMLTHALQPRRSSNETTGCMGVGIFVLHLGYVFRMESGRDHLMVVWYKSGGSVFVALCNFGFVLVEGPLYVTYSSGW